MIDTPAKGNTELYATLTAFQEQAVNRFQHREPKLNTVFPALQGNSLEKMTPKLAELLPGSELAFRLWSYDLDRADGKVEGHSHRASILAVAIGTQLGISEVDCMYIRHGALLHNIGSALIPDSVVNKCARLSDDDCLVIRIHPTREVALPSPVAVISRALEIPLYHHERWDGTGFPFRLKGADIPISARVFAVADAWDLLTININRKSRTAVLEALNTLNSHSGKQFDPKVVRALIELVSAPKVATEQQKPASEPASSSITDRVKDLWGDALKRISNPK
jgi:HD-GYP domain-containing protein (c-di-GMP phosphodiesterase class II)